MQMLYNSDQYAVVQFDVQEAPQPGAADESVLARPAALSRGGYEIVDKMSRTEIFIQGALAERFEKGVRSLVEAGRQTEEAFDEYIAGFTGLAGQPLVLH
jgi:hypothetical protein